GGGNRAAATHRLSLFAFYLCYLCYLWLMFFDGRRPETCRMSVRYPSLALGLFLLLVAPLRADDWPQWLGPQRDGVWRETGILDKFPSAGPPVRWRTAICAGYAGPSVGGGKVAVGWMWVGWEEYTSGSAFIVEPVRRTVRA